MAAARACGEGAVGFILNYDYQGETVNANNNPLNGDDNRYSTVSYWRDMDEIMMLMASHQIYLAEDLAAESTVIVPNERSLMNTICCIKEHGARPCGPLEA